MNLRSHPMGESKLKLAKREEMLLSCAGVQTMAGRVQVRWETESAATPMGQLAYFIEFLTVTGLWSRWQESCPLFYTSPNAPSKADVLGTWMLSVLSGHKRYSHVTTIRCAGVNPGLLGMRKVISEDALRRALTAIPETEGVAWLDGHLHESLSLRFAAMASIPGCWACARSSAKMPCAVRSRRSPKPRGWLGWTVISMRVCHCDSLRWRQSRVAGHAQGHQRRCPAPCAHGDPRNRGGGLAGRSSP